MLELKNLDKIDVYWFSQQSSCYSAAELKKYKLLLKNLIGDIDEELERREENEREFYGAKV